MRIALAVVLVGLAVSNSASALDKGDFRNQLAGRPRGRWFLSGSRRRHLYQIRLDVTIKPGGPPSNGGYLLIAGKIEFYMGGDMLGDFWRRNRAFRRSPSRRNIKRIRKPSCRTREPGLTNGPICQGRRRGSAG